MVFFPQWAGFFFLIILCSSGRPPLLFLTKNIHRSPSTSISDAGKNSSHTKVPKQTYYSFPHPLCATRWRRHQRCRRAPAHQLSCPPPTTRGAANTDAKDTAHVPLGPRFAVGWRLGVGWYWAAQPAMPIRTQS